MRPNSRSYDLSSFLVENVPLLAYVLLGYLLLAITTAILPQLTHANHSSCWKSLKLVLLKVPFMDHSQLPRVHLRIMLFFFSIFLFFQLNFLSNTIKTEKVTIPTDDLIDSPAKLLATTKTLTINQGGLKWLKQAPEGSFLRKLLCVKKIAEIDAKDLDKMRKNIDGYLTLEKEIAVVFWMSLFSQDARDSGVVAFLPEVTYYETLDGFTMRRSLEEERERFINKV